MDPDVLLRRLRDAAGDAPLPPLTLDPGAVSTRRGPAGVVVTRMRALVLRLIAPSLGELIAQLERDRHRERSELADLRRRVESLEAAASGSAPTTEHSGPAAPG